MPNNPNAVANLKSYKPGQSGNPAGKPKGAKHLSTWIQELLHDETFEAEILEGYSYKKFKGAPVKAIVRVAMKKALAGDQRWADWLAKYGYGTKTEVEHSGAVATGAIDPALADDFAQFLENKTKQ